MWLGYNELHTSKFGGKNIELTMRPQMGHKLVTS